ncbi:MAG: hypothetical protein Fur0024_3680 [Patescibacteria group bacterium]
MKRYYHSKFVYLYPVLLFLVFLFIGSSVPVILIVGALVSVILGFILNNEYIELTENSVIIKKNLSFLLTTEEIPYSKINSVNTKILFGSSFGDIVIRTGNNEENIFRDVNNPNLIKNEIMQKIKI